MSYYMYIEETLDHEKMTRKDSEVGASTRE
jgi:hypothetical protein